MFWLDIREKFFTRTSYSTGTRLFKDVEVPGKVFKNQKDKVRADLVYFGNDPAMSIWLETETSCSLFQTTFLRFNSVKICSTNSFPRRLKFLLILH